MVNNEILKAIEEYDKPKISIVMQVYLGDYPGARSNPIDKFKRAIKSFQTQVYKNCELIIVADGCDITKSVYEENFKNDAKIKFIYVDKGEDVLNMYQEVERDGKKYKYFRGMPRKIGVAAVTGELITYMDGDDYLLPQHTLSIMMHYNLNKNKDWWINRTWYDNASVEWENHPIIKDTTNQEKFEFSQFKSQKWNKIQLQENRIILSPWLFTHRATCNTKWKDTIGGSEDVDFNKRLRSEYPNGIDYESATYIRCHYTNKWDV